jgi:hypothetical protein
MIYKACGVGEDKPSVEFEFTDKVVEITLAKEGFTYTAISLEDWNKIIKATEINNETIIKKEIKP